MSLRLYFLNLMVMIILVVVTVSIGRLTIQAQDAGAQQSASVAVSQGYTWHQAFMPGDWSAVSR